MRFFSLSLLALITALFYTQAALAAQPRPVRDAKTLGLTIEPEIHVAGPGGFRAFLTIDRFWDQIDVTHISNPERAIKSREALLSIWQATTGTSASKLRYIKYIAIMNGPTVVVLDRIWSTRREDELAKMQGEDDDVDDYGESYMYGSDGEETDDIIEPIMTIKRPPTGEKDQRFSDLLNKTPFGVGAAKMCLEFTEMQNHYIESFTIGFTKEDHRCSSALPAVSKAISASKTFPSLLFCRAHAVLSRLAISVLGGVVDDLLVLDANPFISDHDLALGRIDPAGLQRPANLPVVQIAGKGQHMLDVANPIGHSRVRVDYGPAKADLRPRRRANKINFSPKRVTIGDGRLCLYIGKTADDPARAASTNSGAGCFFLDLIPKPASSVFIEVAGNAPYAQK
ncbi:hypothetical protein CSUB01_00712 [Colletotrichum sublineola]|uniref:Uncharacterized protein n=1 Tax=Colletotrichum sublineola TaxID=1173701 RepID=A0A066XJX3_COLSU|nr:hypothetical protein CSUB01_00712 [Colletotrichum sublineola]